MKSFLAAVAASMVLLFVALPANAYTFTQTLEVGNTGVAVSALQQILQRLGFYTYPEITGYFGPTTREGVVAYQKAHSIDSLGIVGPKTRAALNVDSVTSSSVMTTAPSRQSTAPAAFSRDLAIGESGSDVSELQQLLRTAGFYTYPEITGYFGAKTREALSLYQISEGIEPTGRIDKSTRSALTGQSPRSVRSNPSTVQPPIATWLSGGGASPVPSGIASIDAIQQSSQTSDTISPTISFISPTRNQTISGSFVTSPILITASSTDDRGVAGVRFILDGVSIGPQLTTAPYSIAWDTASSTNGDHTLTAVAWDAAGNRATSTVSVTIANTWPNHPLIGAIRWDAWWAPTPDATSSPGIYGIGAPLWNDYDFRKPFYGWFESGVPNQQAIMDQEINYAADAGLDYWMFDWYPQNQGATTTHLMDAYNNYLASPYKNRIKFAFMMSADSTNWSYQSDFLINAIQDPQYLKTPDNRPVIFWWNTSNIPGTGFGPTWRNYFASINQRAMALGLGKPLYITANMDISSADRFELDGVSSYGPAGSGAPTPSSCWNEQVKSDTSNWDRIASTYLRVVPGLTAVNDSRARGGVRWMQLSTYSQWESHVRSAYQWVSNAPVASVGTQPMMLIYAWDEIDEGGPGIVPTLQEGTKYLDAIKAVKTGTYPSTYTDTYNGDNCAISYTGAWSYVFPVANSYQNDEQVSYSEGDVAVLTTDKTAGFTVKGVTGPGRGKAQFSIDGMVISVADLSAISTSTKQTLFTSGSLPAGTHSLTIKNVSTDTAHQIVGIDSIDVLVKR